MRRVAGGAWCSFDTAVREIDENLGDLAADVPVNSLISDRLRMSL